MLEFSGTSLGVRVAAESRMDAEKLNHLSYRIIGAGVEVHRALGPGLLENTYRICMVYELRERQMNVVTEQGFPSVTRTSFSMAATASTSSWRTR